MLHEAYIFLRLHSAHACGVVMRLDVPLPFVLVLSVESVDCFRGVTPWTSIKLETCKYVEFERVK